MSDIFGHKDGQINQLQNELVMSEINSAHHDERAASLTLENADLATQLAEANERIKVLEEALKELKAKLAGALKTAFSPQP